MRFSTLAVAVAALASAHTASAQPIEVLSPPKTPRSATPARSECVPAAPGLQGPDIECVLNLTPPERGAAPAPPSRILIRAQWAPAKRCAARQAQVVELEATTGRQAALPVVEQAAPARACAS